jgi:hypothetical protein
VFIQTRILPCWKLVATKTARERLSTKGELQQYNGDHAGFTLTNAPVKRLLKIIWGYHQLEPPFIDETGITGNIDITMDALMTNLDDIRNCLQKNGLSLVRSTMKMKVIVIRDP